MLKGLNNEITMFLYHQYLIHWGPSIRIGKVTGPSLFNSLSVLIHLSVL